MANGSHSLVALSTNCTYTAVFLARRSSALLTRHSSVILILYQKASGRSRRKTEEHTMATTRDVSFPTPSLVFFSFFLSPSSFSTFLGLT